MGHFEGMVRWGGRREGVRFGAFSGGDLEVLLLFWGEDCAGLILRS